MIREAEGAGQKGNMTKWKANNTTETQTRVPTAAFQSQLLRLIIRSNLSFHTPHRPNGWISRSDYTDQLLCDVCQDWCLLSNLLRNESGPQSSYFSAPIAAKFLLRHAVQRWQASTCCVCTWCVFVSISAIVAQAFLNMWQAPPPPTPTPHHTQRQTFFLLMLLSDWMSQWENLLLIISIYYSYVSILMPEISWNRFVPG